MMRSELFYCRDGTIMMSSLFVRHQLRRDFIKDDVTKSRLLRFTVFIRSLSEKIVVLKRLFIIILFVSTNKGIYINLEES